MLKNSQNLKQLNNNINNTGVKPKQSKHQNNQKIYKNERKATLHSKPVVTDET